MPDITKQGRSHDASVIIENLEGKSIEEARTELTKLETSQVNDVRGLVDQILEPGHDEDSQKYGAIKQAADMVYGEKLEGREGQLLTDQAVETALKPLELAEEGAEDTGVSVSGVELGDLEQRNQETMAAQDLEKLRSLNPNEQAEFLNGMKSEKRVAVMDLINKAEGPTLMEANKMSKILNETLKLNVSPEAVDSIFQNYKKERGAIFQTGEWPLLRNILSTKDLSEKDINGKIEGVIAHAYKIENPGEEFPPYARVA